MSNRLNKILSAHFQDFAKVVPEKFLAEPPFIFDFTEKNQELAKIDLGDLAAFNYFVSQTLARAGKLMGAGGYGEDRVMYKKSALFTRPGQEPRSVHLAVDLWLPAGTAVFAPLSGKIHSFQDNRAYLDYGPTIILEHILDKATFYTLYGHLSRKSLENLSPGRHIAAGEQIAALGTEAENGSYPPHLHFQIISDMLEKQGDFPGVAKPSQSARYLAMCPNPNLILKIPNLT